MSNLPFSNLPTAALDVKTDPLLTNFAELDISTALVPFLLAFRLLPTSWYRISIILNLKVTSPDVASTCSMRNVPAVVAFA